MTDLLAIVQQHRDPFIVKGFERRISVHVEHLDLGAEVGSQWPKGDFHLLTEMTVAPRHQRQFHGLGH